MDLRIEPLVSGAAEEGPAARRSPGSSRQALEALIALGREPNAHDPRLLQRTSAKLISELFFAPLLAEMRKLPFGRKLAYGGRTEDIFGQQLDNHIADTLAWCNCGGLTRQLTERLRTGKWGLPGTPGVPGSDQSAGFGASA